LAYILVVAKRGRRASGRACRVYEFDRLGDLLRAADRLKGRRLWAFCERDRIPLERSELPHPVG
jgi:hypothetical protein